MEELNVIKQVVELAFASGRIKKLEEIKIVIIALQKLEEKLTKVLEDKPPVVSNDGNN